MVQQATRVIIRWRLDPQAASHQAGVLVVQESGREEEEEFSFTQTSWRTSSSLSSMQIKSSTQLKLCSNYWELVFLYQIRRQNLQRRRRPPPPRCCIGQGRRRDLAEAAQRQAGPLLLPSQFLVRFFHHRLHPLWICFPPRVEQLQHLWKSKLSSTK